MFAGRRRALLSAALLSAALLGSAALLAGGPARGQDRSHELWRSDVTPDQIRAALARMGAGGAAGLDPFGEMIRDYLLKNNPGIDKEKAEDAIRRLTANKQLMDQLKRVADEKRTEPGGTGEPTQDDLAKLFEARRRAGDLPKLPDGINGFGEQKGGPEFPPTDPRVGPRPPNFNPKTEPQPPDPIRPPAKVEPQPVPNWAPPKGPLGKTEFQPPPPAGGDAPPITLDENPFGDPEESSDPKTKSLEAFAAMWERNIGPLDETPEVRRALFDLVAGNGLDFDLKDDKGNSFWDILKNGTADGTAFGDVFNGANPGGANWSPGNWELPKFGNWFGSGTGSSSGGGFSSSWWGGGSGRPRTGPSSGGGWGSSGWGSGGVGGLGGAWLPFAILLLVVLGVVVWLKLKSLQGAAAVPALAGAGLGPWPVDPRSIQTREDVVKAFEYLSVLICGPAARNWTHGAIAEALADLAATRGETAVMLARLYELARYAPLDEPLTEGELAEARGLVCSLAGVSY